LYRCGEVTQRRIAKRNKERLEKLRAAEEKENGGGGGGDGDY
jgi:hypothetical protein